MGSISCICLGDCSCNVVCNPYLPATTWSITALAKSLTLTRNSTWKCYFQSPIICWNDDIELTNDWTTLLQDFGAASGESPNCPSCCPGETYDRLVFQVAVKQRQKRWRQVHHELYATIYPVDVSGNETSSSVCTDKLRIKVVHTVAVVYFYGASMIAWCRWRKDAITCNDPITIVVGGWSTDSEPTMPDVDIPPCFLWQSPFNNFSICSISVGPSVTPVDTWDTRVVTTLRKIECVYGTCVHTTIDGIIPVVLALHKDCDGTSPIFGWNFNFCSNPLIGSLDVLMSQKTYTYLSDVFPCSAIPSNPVTLTLQTPYIIPSDTTTTCGTETIHFTWPTIPTTINITI